MLPRLAFTHTVKNVQSFVHMLHNSNTKHHNAGVKEPPGESGLSEHTPTSSHMTCGCSECCFVWHIRQYVLLWWLYAVLCYCGVCAESGRSLPTRRRSTGSGNPTKTSNHTAQSLSSTSWNDLQKTIRIDTTANHPHNDFATVR